MLSLELKNFRLFTKKSFNLERQTVLLGPNGTGKTTVLEALYFVNFCRSYRNAQDRNLIKWGQDTSYIKLRNQQLDLTVSISTYGGKCNKIAKRSKTKIQLIEFIGLFPVVIFAPELIEIISGAPQIRRRYLDMTLSSVDKVYAKDLLDYQKLIKQRNELLKKRITQLDYLDPWETKIAQIGRQLIIKRMSLVNFLDNLINDFYNKISNSQNNKITLKYFSTIPDLSKYEEALVNSRKKDFEVGNTGIGPHRDDLLIELNRHPALINASRGEQRTILLALKRAEIEFVETKLKNESPTLLLDDMFSELDLSRSKTLTQEIINYPAIITSTDAAQISSKLLKNSLVIKI